MGDYLDKDILILGCGNTLFGDDGFGPAVVAYLEQNFEIPAGVGVINAGLSVRKILFSVILHDQKPDKIIVVDAVDVGKPPGEIFELEIENLPRVKIDDFSMHQLPTSNLLRELKEIGGVELKIIAAQVQTIPEEVAPGLSPVIEAAIPAACEMILADIR